MQQEINPTIIDESISEKEAFDFAANVSDRFSNPFLDHKWLSISLNYSSKMQMRNVELLKGFANKMGIVPRFMSLGFAAYILFMKCELSSDGTYIGDAGYGSYTINDDKASLFADLWSTYDTKNLVNRVLENQSLWHTDLNDIPGFAKSVEDDLKLLLNIRVVDVIQQLTESKGI